MEHHLVAIKIDKLQNSPIAGKESHLNLYFYLLCIVIKSSQGESKEKQRVNYTAALVPQNKSHHMPVFVIVTGYDYHLSHVPYPSRLKRNITFGITCYFHKRFNLLMSADCIASCIINSLERIYCATL